MQFVIVSQALFLFLLLKLTHSSLTYFQLNEYLLNDILCSNMKVETQDVSCDVGNV